jgi:hypothetical protein
MFQEKDGCFKEENACCKGGNGCCKEEEKRVGRGNGGDGLIRGQQFTNLVGALFCVFA